MSQDQKEWRKAIGDIPLLLEVQADFRPVSGLSPTVEVYKASNNDYVDWASGIFTSSGGTRMGAMSGLPLQGHIYHRTFNPLTFGDATLNPVYYVVYKATIPSGFVTPTRTLSQDTPVTKSEIHTFLEPGDLPSGTLTTGLVASFVP